MNPRLELVVSPSGQTRLETRGFSGPACRQASRFLEQALGLRQAESLTAEFYVAAAERAVEPEQLGPER